MVKLVEDPAANRLVLEIEDDGKGMDEEMLNHITNPFYTTKEGKKFGLGLSLLSQACEETGGFMELRRGQAGGVKVTASFIKDHVDLKPMGNIRKTLRVLRAAHPGVRLTFEHIQLTGGCQSCN
jgi:K+-sensing histidine kinase KdpD